MNHRTIKLAASWLQHLQSEFEQDYMQKLSQFLREEKAAGQVIYPTGENIFAALNTTALHKVKVVILGQDPYHGANQAHGLSFSVPKEVKIPPSLRNIYQEIRNDIGVTPPNHGYLESWAEQGVLLLNSVLTVRESQAASHQGKGWERFTDKVIEIINHQTQNVVFLLWGSYAQKKGQAIDQQRHLILKTTHPSPLSAHRGFLGCRHFSQTNHYLQQHGKSAIDWSILK